MYGLSNMVGHVLKLWAYWAMLLVISQHMLMRSQTGAIFLCDTW